MQSIKKLCSLVTIFLTLMCAYFLYHAAPLRPRHFEHVEREFEQHKQQLIDYYCSPSYLTDATDACAKAEHYFSQLPVRKNSVIIFDIDDTALIHFQTREKFNFVWSQMPHLVSAQKNDFDPALEPVLKLYKMLIKKGFKIIFMTGRRNDIREKTTHNLAAHGFDTYEQLILFPRELADKISIGQWKAAERKKLAQNYDIVGNVGDRPVDFEDGNNGYIVKLPNYLY